MSMRRCIALLGDVAVGMAMAALLFVCAVLLGHAMRAHAADDAGPPAPDTPTRGLIVQTQAGPLVCASQPGTPWLCATGVLLECDLTPVGMACDRVGGTAKPSPETGV